MRLIDADAYDFPDDLIYEPTIEAEPVRHGEWKKRERKWIDEDGKEWIKFDGIFCSACGNSSPPYNYCPNCGAKMDGKENYEK